MNQTRYRSVQMVHRYIRDGSLFRENSAGKLGCERRIDSAGRHLWDIIAVNMTEEELQKVSPADLRSRTHEELLILLDCWRNNSGYFERIREELTQRFLGRIGDLIEKQIEATAEVRTAVDRLTTSSDHLEGLTIRLNRLTYILIVLTALAVVVPVAIEVWHVKREIDAPVTPIAIQHLLPTVPQTPPLPAR